MRRILLAAVAMAGALGFVTADAQTLRYTASAPLLTMDPHATNDFVTQMVMTQIYESLVKIDADLSLQPGLALSWEHLGDRTWRFRLRPNVRFHDGTPLQASDIAFSIERAREGRFWAAFAGAVERVEIVDPTTINLITRVPDPLLPRKMARVQIMSEAWARAHGAERAHSLAATGGDFHAQRNANGTGFMVLRSHDTQRTAMARNPNWWGRPTGNVQEAVFRQIAAAPTRVAALLSNEVDLVTDLPIQDIERVRAAAGMRVEQVPQLLMMQFELDGTREEGNAVWDRQGNPLPRNPLRDLRVRRAFAHAIDANAIAQRIMRGSARVIGSAGIPGVNGYQADLDQRWPTDLALARRLLAEAGFPDGFRVQLNCPTDRYVNTEAICRAAAQMLAQINVDVVLNLQTWAAFVPPLTRLESSFHLIGSGPNGQDTQDTLQATMMTRQGENGFFNWARWTNPEFDATVTQLLGEFDPARRTQLYHRALQISRDNVHAVYLHTQMVTWGVRANVAARIRQDAIVSLEYASVN